MLLVSFSKQDIIEALGRHIIEALSAQYPHHSFGGGRPAGRVDNAFAISVLYSSGWKSSVVMHIYGADTDGEPTVRIVRRLWPTIHELKKEIRAIKPKNIYWKTTIGIRYQHYVKTRSTKLHLTDPESITKAIDKFIEWMKHDISNNIPARRYYLRVLHGRGTHYRLGYGRTNI